MKIKIQVFIIAVLIMAFMSTGVSGQIKLEMQGVDENSFDGKGGPAMGRPEEAAAQRLLQEEIAALESENIYFEYGKADIIREAEDILDKKVNFLCLENNLSYDVIIEGNCDEKEADKYKELGKNRADAAKQYLVSQGIRADRIITIDLGDEKPLDKGHNETAWSKNRRNEFKFEKN